MIEWKPVKDYEGYYEVSNKGDVRRVMSSRGSVAGKIRKTFVGTSGYKCLSLSKENQQQTKMVHRLVAEAFYGPSELQVNHINGDKLDNRAENLEWATQSENMKHAVATGLFKARDMSGEKNPFSKLTDKERTSIGLMRYMRVPQKKIAEMFGICVATVQKQPKVALVC